MGSPVNLSLPRSTYRYVPKPLADHQEQLYQRIIALSWHHPRYGYRRIRALLAREGWTVSRKQVQRIRRREGLKVRSKPKKIPRRGISTGSELTPSTSRMRPDHKTGESIVQMYADEYGNGVVGAYNRKGKGRTLEPGP